MKIFITGASGYIGHSVTKAFRANGHQVYGLVRSQESAHSLSLEEIWPVMGDLEQPDSYRHVLDEVEVVVHCAFDFTSDKGVEHDERTVNTILEVLTRSSRPRTFIYTSGTWVYGSQGDKRVDESMPPNPLEIVKWRPVQEEKVLKATTPMLRTVVMRPSHVYGGVGGLTNLLFNSTQNGAVSIVGEGHNHWPMVHVQDLAYAYVSAAEKGVTHEIFNVADDSTATFHEIASAIAKIAKLEGKINSISKEEAEKQFGPIIEGLMVDLMINNSHVKQLLEWKIRHASFISEVDIYYNAWQATQQAEEF